MAILYCYWHLVVKHCNFTLLLTCSSQQWQFAPPHSTDQRRERSLHCSMLSLTLKGRYTPHSTLSKDSVISSLFNVVIETQGQIYTPIQYYQRREWSLHCSMLSLTLKGRYTPPVNSSKGQSDLFTVQCCHWHSKADILPPSFKQQISLIARSTTMHIYIGGR